MTPLEFQNATRLCHEKLMRLKNHDLQEGLISYNPLDGKYHPTENWDLFGYSQKELLEGL
jgi:hypothetical protein